MNPWKFAALSLGAVVAVTILAAQGPVNPPVNVKAGNGTAALPSISFASDPDTGFYRKAANSIGWSLGGTAFGYVDSVGNFVSGAGGTGAGSSITSGTGNFFWGSRAGALATSASNNIFMGLDSGLLVTTGGSNNPNFNVCIGYRTCSTTTDGGNIALGQVALGADSGGSNSVYSGTALGEFALSKVKTSQKDTAVGSFTLTNYLRGGQMSAFGRGAGTYVAEGSYSLFAGHGAGGFNVASTENIIIGDSSGYGAKTGVPPRITASQSGTTLTVTVFNAGDTALEVGMVCVSTIGAALANNITVTALDGTGSGGTGTYSVSPSQTVSSQTMQCGFANTNNIFIGKSNGSKGYADTGNIVIGNSVQPASASNATVIGTGQTTAYLSGRFSYGSGPAAIASAIGVTYTTAEFLGGYIKRSGAAGVSDTTPTAAQIVAGLPGCEAGKTTFDLWIRSTNTGTLTLVAGDAGVTLDGTTTIATVFSRFYKGTVTNCTASSEAVTISGVATAAN